MRIESLRPCCSWLSMTVLSSDTSFSRSRILTSFSCPSFCSVTMDWHIDFKFSFSFWEIGSSNDLMMGSNINWNLFTTSSSFRASKTDALDSAICVDLILYCLVNTCMDRQTSQCQFYLNGYRASPVDFTVTLDPLGCHKSFIFTDKEFEYSSNFDHISL